MKSTSLYLEFILRWLVAVIYLQTLYYKFSGHPESMYIFSKLGLEPYGRIGLGCIELLVSILLLIPSYSAFGMLLSVGVISGALVSHLGPIGIEVMGDHGKLFLLAAVVWISSVSYLYLFRKELKNYIQKIKFQL